MSDVKENEVKGLMKINNVVLEIPINSAVIVDRPIRIKKVLVRNFVNLFNSFL